MTDRNIGYPYEGIKVRPTITRKGKAYRWPFMVDTRIVKGEAQDALFVERPANPFLPTQLRLAYHGSQVA